MILLEDNRKALYQWDLNQRLILIDIEVGTEVQISDSSNTYEYCLTTKAYNENGNVYAKIPNIYLQKSGILYVYIYVYQEDKSYTKYYTEVIVLPRKKPSNYVYTETEKYTVSEMLKDALEEAKASGEFKGDKGDPFTYDDFTPEQLEALKPVKGTDYFTDSEVKQIQNEVSSGAIGDFKAVVDSETNKYNTNATEKLNTYNSNAETKTAEYNQNADNRVTEFDSHTEQIQADISKLKDDLDYKLDIEHKKTESLIDLSKFTICPSVYKIITKTIDNVEYQAISQDPITVSYIWSLLDTKYTEVEYRFNYSKPYIVLCANENYALALQANATSGNVYEYTQDNKEYKPGIYLNTDISLVTTNDKIKYVRKGTKVALYVLRDGAYVKILKDEWVDVANSYSSLSDHYNFDTDISFGIVTMNSYRHEANIYDATCSIVVEREYATKSEFDDLKADVEKGGKIDPKTIDLFMFMGQSNMAGRGTASQAPTVPSGNGYEFRAISDPTKLYDVSEPFGYNENVEGGIYDGYVGSGLSKSGSMVSAFMNEYKLRTGVSIVGVSASEGGTRIGYWLPTQIPSSTANRYNDAKNRFDTAVAWLNSNGYTIRHKYMLWCQGESDGDDNLSASDYKSRFETMANAWFANGIEKIFIVRIGNNRDNATLYDALMQAQNEICQTYENVIMASTEFAKMAILNLMKDQFHYQQTAYNMVGANAGKNCAFYVNNGKEPTMWDSEFNNLYYSHKDD